VAKGKLISKVGGTEYGVEFNLKTVANLRKEPVTGTVAPGKPMHQLTVDADELIPDGDYELHPEGTTDVINVVKSGDGCSVV
jgi:hypothetical protein